MALGRHVILLIGLLPRFLSESLCLWDVWESL